MSSSHQRRAISRHGGIATSRGTHAQGGFDPTGGGDGGYGSYMDPSQIGAWQIPPGSVNDGVIDPGGLDGDESITPGSVSFTPFADTVRPVGIISGSGGNDTLLLETGDDILLETGDLIVLEQSVADPAAGLPVLPHADYPEGSVVFNMADYKIYRNAAEVWTRSADGADLLVDSVTAGVIAAGAIGASEISAGAITTEKFAATAVIALVTNSGATVVINASGITVTDGDITVTNPGSTVIIDGTSNMFKIAASGSHSVVSVADTQQIGTTTLTALSFAATPIAMQIHATSNATTAQKILGEATYLNGVWYASNISGGAANDPFMYVQSLIQGWIQLTGDDPVVKVAIKSDTSSITAYQYYYVLQETAF